MEEQRAFTTTVPVNLDHHHHHFQHTSFSNPTNEMGFVHYFEHQNQALNFLAGKNSSASFGSSEVGSRVPWNEPEHHQNQVESVLPNKAAVNDETCNGDDTNEAGYSWLSHTASYSDNNSKMKIKRKLREPRFCFQTRSDVDVLDDGYKWRKYGQKIVKNSLHPRSYFRCTHSNCRVKKRVERLSEDCRMVITMYEGRHNHSPSDDSKSSAEREFFTSL